MLVKASATYSLFLSSDTSATDGSSATDTILVLMTPTSLPTTIESSPTMSTWLRSLSTCIE